MNYLKKIILQDPDDAVVNYNSNLVRYLHFVRGDAYKLSTAVAAAIADKLGGYIEEDEEDEKTIAIIRHLGRRVADVCLLDRERRQVMIEFVDATPEEVIKITSLFFPQE
jgi:hypothetical protein